MPTPTLGTRSQCEQFVEGKSVTAGYPSRHFCLSVLLQAVGWRPFPVVDGRCRRWVVAGTRRLSEVEEVGREGVLPVCSARRDRREGAADGRLLSPPGRVMTAKAASCEAQASTQRLYPSRPHRGDNLGAYRSLCDRVRLTLLMSRCCDSDFNAVRDEPWNLLVGSWTGFDRPNRSFWWQ